MIGRCDQRLKAGAERPVNPVVAVAEARVINNRRRVKELPARKRPDINWPPPNHGESWTHSLTARKRLNDECVTLRLGSARRCKVHPSTFESTCCEQSIVR